jgi:hypothetical protein
MGGYHQVTPKLRNGAVDISVTFMLGLFLHARLPPGAEHDAPGLAPRV